MGGVSNRNWIFWEKKNIFCPKSSFLAPFRDSFFQTCTPGHIWGRGDLSRKFLYCWYMAFKWILKAFHKISPKYSLISEALFQLWNQKQWKEVLLFVWQSSPYLDMFALKKNQGRLAANRGRHQVVIIQEKQTPLSTGSLVRDGQTLGLMTMISPTWEITTSVGIPMGLLNSKCGAIPLILNMSARIAQFHFVLL